MLGDFRDLILQHPGARICVMGGAPSLKEHLDQVEADIYISTNAHGVDWVKPDYVLAMDEQHSRHNYAPMGSWLRGKTDAPIISPHGYADYRLGMWPQNPRFVLSGMIATWAAFAMGASVVILAGCDGFGGDPGYIHEARKIARDVHCPVRVVGAGPLAQVWPVYNREETFMDSTPHSTIDALKGNDGRVVIRAIKPCTVGRIDLAKGADMVAMRHEVARLLKHRMVEEIAFAPEQEDGADDETSTEPKRRGRKPKTA